MCGSGVAGILFAMEMRELFDCSSCQNVIMYVNKTSYGLYGLVLTLKGLALDCLVILWIV